MTWVITGNSNISTSNFLGPTNTAPLIIKTSNVERMRIASSGEVSVGPSSPRANYKLDVYGMLHADEIYKNGSPLISSQWTDATGGINYTAGSVGIGAVDATYKLSVAGAINATEVNRNGSPLISSQWASVTGGISYTAGNVGIGVGDPRRRVQIGGDVAGIGLDPSDASPNAGYIRFGDNTGWKLHFGRSRESATGAPNTGTTGVLMTLQDNGRVGIGTTAPGARLDISGSGGVAQCCAPIAPTLSLAEASSSAGRQAWLQFHNAGEAEAYIRLAGAGPSGSGRGGQQRLEIGANRGGTAGLTVTGNVGIRTTDPQQTLQVGADVSGVGLAPSEASPNAGYVRWGDNTGWKLHFGRSRESSGGALNAGTSGVLLMMQDNGRVGIGTITPRTTLEVRGSLTLEEGGSPVLFTGTGTSELNRYLLLANSPDSTSASRLKAGGVLVSDTYAYANPPKNNLIVKGNVGIGTTMPGERLTVEGGNIQIRQFPANDTNPSLTSLQLVNRGAGGNALYWSLYTAAVGGRFGVNPNSFEIWEYPATRSRFQIRPGGNTILAPAGGNVGVGTVTPLNRLDVNGDVALMGKHALRGNDSWLRLNQDGAFTSGVHTPGVFAPVSLNVGGLGGWGNPGWGNVWVAGSVGIGTTTQYGRVMIEHDSVPLSLRETG